jgi:basic membrane lipoprotein Med (substrate-binding protein (PBP1-ABC) superfamily)
MSNIIKAILSINPNAKVSVSNNDINTIQWHNGTQPISKELILAKVAELQAEYEAKQYQRDRAKSYPTIQEQLDMQYWDKINGTNNWQDAINAVKAQYPKGN